MNFEQQDLLKIYSETMQYLSNEVHVWMLVRDDQGNIKTWSLVNANPAALEVWGKDLDSII